MLQFGGRSGGRRKKEKKLNLHLLQTPTKVRPFTKTRYVYKPSVVSQSASDKIKPGVIVNVIGVNESEDADTTAVKVVRHDIWADHTNKYDRKCRRIWPKLDEGGPCSCELPIEEMPEPLRGHTIIVLLRDLGR